MNKILLLGCLTLSLCSQPMYAGQAPEESKLNWKLYGTAGTKLTDALFTLQRMGESDKAEALAADYDKSYRAIISEKAIERRTDLTATKKEALRQASQKEYKQIAQKLRQEIFDAEMGLFDRLLKEPQKNQSQLLALKTVLQDMSEPTQDNKQKLTNMKTKFAQAQKAGAFEEPSFEETGAPQQREPSEKAGA